MKHENLEGEQIKNEKQNEKGIRYVICRIGIRISGV